MSQIAVEKHADAEFGIESSGDFFVNTTQAINGDVNFELPAGRALVIKIGGEPVLHVSQEDGNLRIDFGAAASERMVLGDALMALLNEFFTTKFDAHVHTSPTGPPADKFKGTQMTEKQLASGVRVTPG